MNTKAVLDGAYAAFKKWHAEVGDQDSEYTWMQAWTAAVLASADNPSTACADEPVAWALQLKNGSLEFNSGYGMFQTMDIAERAHRQHLGSIAVVPLYLAAPVAQSTAGAEKLRAALEGLHRVCQIALAGKDGTQYANFETRAGHFVKAVDVMQAAEEALAAPAAQAPMPQWISVEDRLPPEGEPVLTYGSKRVQGAVMQYTKTDKWQIETANEWHSAYAPTHWMPLPAAPEQSALRTASKEGGAA